jgi:hypothetical protein
MASSEAYGAQTKVVYDANASSWFDEFDESKDLDYMS